MGLTAISRPWPANRIARLEDVAGSPHAALQPVDSRIPQLHRPSHRPRRRTEGQNQARGSGRPRHDGLGRGLPTVVGRALRPCRHPARGGLGLISPLESIGSADGPLQRALQSVAAGRIAANVEPEPSFDVTISSPRCRLRMCLTMASPRPVPPFSRLAATLTL
jgi:hypothetical protein